MQKISGPLMDRIDIHIDVPAVNYKEMRSTSEPEGSAQIRERVMRAREIQLRRFMRPEIRNDAGQQPSNAGEGARATHPSNATRTYRNAQMTPRQIRVHCDLSVDCERLLERAMVQQGLTARAHDRILKVSRTIADLEGQPGIQPKHIAEAIQYRTLGRTFWA